MIEMQYVDR